MQLKGRTSLVTGANRGIGLEVCRQLGQEGSTILMGVRDPDRSSESLKKIVDGGITARLVHVDVSDVNSIYSFLKSVNQPIDILINNAAILDRASDVLSLSDEEFEKVIQTNLIGAAILAKNLAQQMKKRGWGRIVNVSSGMGSIGRGLGAGSPAYRISKLSLNGVTICLAYALQGSNVLVNSVDPGWVRTDMGGKLASRSVETGALGIVWAALLPDDGPTGGFFYDCKLAQW